MLRQSSKTVSQYGRKKRHLIHFLEWNKEAFSMRNKSNVKSRNQMIFEERIYLAGIIGCSLGFLAGLWAILTHGAFEDVTLLSKASISAVAIFVAKALLDKVYIHVLVPSVLNRAARSGTTRTEEELVMNTSLTEIIWPCAILSTGIAFTVIELDLGNAIAVWLSACTGLVIGFLRQWSDKWHNLQARK